jgi:transcriptional regulator GlxA family with amidase domain
MNHIAIVLYDGFDALDAIGPWEVFRKAGNLGAPLSTGFVARGSATRIESSDGLPMTEFGSLDEDDSPWILIPGGAWASRASRGAWGEIERGDLPRIFARRRARGTRFATVCTGAMFLSAAGIARGRAMTTHAVAKAALAEAGVRVLDARVVDDGDLLSSAGVTAGIDLALWMVEKLASRDIAERVRRNLEWTHVAAVAHGAGPGHDRTG